MADKPVFNVGDILNKAPEYEGLPTSLKRYTVLATYQNAQGQFWHVVETWHIGSMIQFPLIDGASRFRVAQKASTKSQERPTAPSAVAGFLRDVEALKADWVTILGPLVQWLDSTTKGKHD